jgi:hypothetical protein
MPQLTFPFTSDLHVDVRVNLSAPDLLVVQAAQQPAPVAVPGIAEIDTGSNVTCVSAAVLRQLGLRPHAQSSTQGISGSAQVWLFRVSLSILDASQPHLPWFVHPDLLVMELPSGLPIDVLIGMDVLLGCRMIVDGPARLLTLDF